MSVTVLIVENDVRQRDALRSLFEESFPDTAVIVAPTLSEALTHDRSGVDAMLLDLGLSDSSGLESLTAIVGRFAPVTVLVLTGTDTEEAGRTIDPGAEDDPKKHRVVRHTIRRFADRTAAAQRDAQNKALGQLGQFALTNVSNATLLGTICDVVGHVLGSTNATFVERSSGKPFSAKTATGCSTGPWPPVSIDDESPLGEAIRTNRPVRVDDIRLDDVRKGGGLATAEIFRQLDVVNVVVVPVRTTLTAPEGVLVVWRKEARAFNDQDVAFLNAVSNILALTMQRNATQEALRESREQMERILDTVPDRIFRFDHELRLQYMNLQAARSLPSVVVGTHVDEFSVSAVHRARWRSGLERALASGVAERFDMDGTSSLRQYDVSLVPLPNGNARSVVVVLRDITERVRAQARYETLFASNVVGVFFCGSDGVITQANRCFLEIVGRQPADVTRRELTIQTVMPPTAQAIHAAQLREIREHGVLPPLPGELLHSSGTSVPVLLASAVVERGPDEIVTFVVDETATRRAENELRNQTLLLDSARDAIVLREMDGRICFWNEGARRLYGWTREEAVGMSMSELVSMSGNDIGPVDASVFGSREWQGELHQHTKAGARIVVESRCSLVPSAYGEPPMMLIINTDITERKSLERQLLQAQRLESLGTLAGGIAHDLNNILLPILMGCEVLKRIGVSPQAEPMLDRIACSARRGTDIIRQLLTFAGGHRVDSEMASPERLVAEVEKMLRETIQPSVAIETAVDPAVWSVACDPTQVATVRSIVKNQHGFLNVYSEPGTTVFKVYLPALYETAPEEADAPPVIPGNGQLVLVIDDEMAIRDVIAATLKSYGYDVLTASDGSEGIALYARNPDVAIVVTDMLMPVLDGPTTIRALRNLNPKVRVLGMSRYTRQRMSGSMPDLLLQKPFRAPDLLNAIHAALSRSE
jgi:PAS domain S-box-containing protein